MKKRITIRLDEDILEYYKTMGKNYQSVINTTLRECMSRTKESVSEYKKNSSEIRKYRTYAGTTRPKSDFTDEDTIQNLKNKIVAIQDDQSWRKQIKSMPKKGKK